ncbi:MAG: hypothetical protein ACYC8V_01790, partial [Caulobacteraceae bacterium]
SGESGSISPALTLQELLTEGWEERSRDGRRWPSGVTILVCGGASLALWGLIIWALVSIF